MARKTVKKLFRSRAVFVINDLKRLHDGTFWSRLFAGWDVSAMIFLPAFPLWRYTGCIVKAGSQQMMFSVVLTVRWNFLFSCEKSCNDTSVNCSRKDAFSGGNVELHLYSAMVTSEEKNPKQTYINIYIYILFLYI